jgi:hypothetical protein
MLFQYFSERSKRHDVESAILLSPFARSGFGKHFGAWFRNVAWNRMANLASANLASETAIERWRELLVSIAVRHEQKSRAGGIRRVPTFLLALRRLRFFFKSLPSVEASSSACATVIQKYEHRPVSFKAVRPSAQEGWWASSFQILEVKFSAVEP